MPADDPLRRRVLARPSRAEEQAPMPGDDLVDADVVMDRAFTLGGPPDQVWPWLVQLGKHRGGWYLPRAVERAVPRRHRALRHLDPALQGLAVGDVIPDWGGADATFTVVELEPGSHLLFGSTRGRMQLTWCLRLQPVDAARTRLHVRLRLGPVSHRRLAAVVGGFVDLVTVAGLAAGLKERLDH